MERANNSSGVCSSPLTRVCLGFFLSVQPLALLAVSTLLMKGITSFAFLKNFRCLDLLLLLLLVQQGLLWLERVLPCLFLRVKLLVLLLLILLLQEDGELLLLLRFVFPLVMLLLSREWRVIQRL